MWLSRPRPARELENKSQPFTYRKVRGSASGDNGEPSAASQSEAVAGPRISPGDLEALVKAHEQESWNRGYREAQENAQAEIAALRQAVAAALQRFELEKEEYYQRVEMHVVRLALEVARKILHREAQMDPLLLAGVVRIALEKLSSATALRLRVHPHQVYGWSEYFAHHDDLARTPEVIADPGLEYGQCWMETDVGTADLSLEGQLAEIERGFFDLLGQRPQNQSQTGA